MPTNILMPALSPTMEEGKLAKWLVKEGQQVKAGDVIAEIETDKATMEVEAVDEGVVEDILVPEGTENVKVNAPIARLSGEGEGVRVFASPLARRIAAQKKLDLTTLKGSGPHGRIIKRDVEGATPAAAKSPTSPEPDPSELYTDVYTEQRA